MLSFARVFRFSEHEIIIHVSVFRSKEMYVSGIIYAVARICLFANAIKVREENPKLKTVRRIIYCYLKHRYACSPILFKEVQRSKSESESESESESKSKLKSQSQAKGEVRSLNRRVVQIKCLAFKIIHRHGWCLSAFSPAILIPSLRHPLFSLLTYIPVTRIRRSIQAQPS